MQIGGEHMSKIWNEILSQINLVIEFTKNKQKEGLYYEDLLKRLKRLANYLQNNSCTDVGLESQRIKGALRAYADTSL
ncbi:hypothetical protein COM83_25710 [Bacillus cereus]|nr:hypothetical protein COM83_25710 [Bacillus cereus]PEQ32964.1 hypothetical protein CN467_22490 [Bacillus cereus]PEX91599.1 hypothetical protein CN465_24055 [Bacillus cereus]PFJ40621.1 hypothetical protein COI99_31055 [Bacillus cereus]PFJ64961.1 hypothetical protein COI95_31525 [Bacillus cereus]